MIRARPFWATQFFDDDPFVQDELEYYSGEIADLAAEDNEREMLYSAPAREEHIAG